MAKLIASGGKGDLNRLSAYEGQFGEGDKGTLVLNCSTSWGLGTLANGLNSALRMAKVDMPEPVKAEGNKIKIKFKKTIAPLALIVGAIIGIALLWLIFTHWELFKDIAPALPWLIVVGAVAIGALYLYAGYTRIKGGT